VSSTDCIGTCSTLGTSLPTKNNSFCTTLCTIGKPGSCGEDPSASGPPSAACILKFASLETEGDLGECAELCDCDSNCKNPGFICSKTTIPKGTDIGRAGACVPKLTFNGVTPGIPCPLTGMADAAPAPAPDADLPPDAGTSPEGGSGTIAASATGGCDCRASGGPTEGPAIPAFGALLAIAALRGRRRWRRQTAARSTPAG
jgi:MYXO-CTERM domain-containing protein